MGHEHDYRTINDDIYGKLEICRECKYKLLTKKDSKTGRIDNRKYLQNHQRDTAQPGGRTGKIFSKYYGEEAGYISRYKK